MTTQLVTLKHSSVNGGNPLFVICKGVNVAYQKRNANNSSANYNSSLTTNRVQTLAISNPVYTISGISFDPNTPVVVRSGTTFTSLSEETFKDLLVIPNLDIDPIFLNVTYGSGKQLSSLHKYSGVRTYDIPVTFHESSNININVTDSKNGYMPTGNVILIEVLRV